MGQLNSTRSATPTSRNTQQLSDPPDLTSHRPTPAPKSQRSRRQSFRHSILNVISRHPFDRSLRNGEPSSPPRDKKRWRLSRRSSKAPEAPAIDLPTDPHIHAPDANEAPDNVSATPRGRTPTLHAADATDTAPATTPLPIATDDPSSSMHEIKRSNPARPSSESHSTHSETHFDTVLDISGSASNSVPLHDSHNTPRDSASISDATVPTTTQPPAPEQAPSPSPSQHLSTNSADGPPNLPHLEPAAPPIRPPQDSLQGHPFPPPGTVVVVQGVVHTNDRPPTPSPLPPTPQNPPSSQAPLAPESTSVPTATASHARHRYRSSRTPIPGQRNSLLAALLRRGDASPSASRTSLNLTEPTSPPVESYAETPSVAPTHAPPATANTAAADSEPQRRPGQLSAGSIEVLGTLLSVATAATAASLVTGSADSFLRSSAATVTASNTATTNNTSTPFTTPAQTAGAEPPSASNPGFGLPAIARALANANPSAAAAVARREREREVDRERIRDRSLWEGLRDRINARTRSVSAPPQAPFSSGLTHLTPEPAPATNANAIEPTPDGPAEGAGAVTGGLVSDALFHEIARAFNLGVGGSYAQGTEPTSEQSAAGGASDHEPYRPAPERPPAAAPAAPPVPEDSFERFLIDLQTDLRTALMQLDSSNEEDEVTAPAPSVVPVRQTAVETSNGDADSAATDGESLFYRPASEPSSNSEVLETSEQLTPRMTADSGWRHEIRQAEGHGQGLRAQVPIPDLWNVEPDEDDSFHDVAENILGSQHNGNVDELTPSAQPVASGSGTTHGNPPVVSPVPATYEPSADGMHAREARASTVGRGGISWWRMYRFPAIRIAAARQSSTNLSEPRQSSGDSVNSSQTPERRPSTAPTTEAPTPDGSMNQEHAGMVVPVIVVGLQSTGIGLGGSPLMRADDMPNAEGGAQTTHTNSPIVDDETLPESGRGRTWQSRATRAINRLSRRGGPATTAEHPAAPVENAGTRVFYIYVFGGYYPPNHQIVTGSDNLDSFEALWELAELLGQVKPPTVTRDDIEKSGLEVFKAGSVQEYETSGRVASNCVERCLVCLDDYQPEDDLRLMSCKHAFHKICVDKWLETGRNNCPACRSKGVNTDILPG